MPEMQDGIVNLYAFLSDEIYVDIKFSVKKTFSYKRKLLFNNMKQLADSIGETEGTLQSFFWHKSAVRLSLLLKLAKLFGTELQESDVIWIGEKTGNGIETPKLPFKFNTEEGGKFVAAILGDGTFSKKGEPGYINWCDYKLAEVMAAAEKIFGKIRMVSCKEHVIMFPAVIGKTIHKLGLRPGRKTVTNPRIPEFVMKGSDECKLGFLRQISDDEGSPEIGKRSYSIRFEFALEIPEEYFKQKEKYVPNLLLDFMNY